MSIFAKQTPNTVCKTKQIIKNVKLKNTIFCFLLAFAIVAKAQSSGEAFKFLSLPQSAHAAALGGDNISIIDDDLSLSAQNPALLINVSDRTLGLTYMTYMSDSKVAGASFNKVFNDYSAGALTAHYVDYGEFDGYTEDNIYTGTFTAKDIAVTAIYSRFLSEYWSGGVSGKFIYSKYETMSAIALGVDLGVNYYNPDNELSLSLVLKNLGGQVKAFEEKYEKIPFDIQVGITKRLSHAPLRISATLTNLHKWGKDDFYNADGSKESFGTLLMKHVTIGADLLLGNNFYASIGYNSRMGDELSTSGSKWEGLTAGAGLHINKVKLNVSYSKLHVSSSSLLFNLSYSL